MYQCPNCNGNLKFNIKRQKMLCEHCNSIFDPYQFGEAEGAKQSEFEVTVFTCPQCGGELFTTDNEMTDFCSFCGSSVVFESRIANEKRPDYIIPFQKTKDDCKEEYLKLIDKAFFVPKALKSPEYIDGFRAIYMPYWIYDVKQQEKINLSGKRKVANNDYVITSYYSFDGNLSASYEGIMYDGSSSFSDNMSRKLVPYKLNGMREFSAAFMSGFYADAADMEAAVYEDDVVDFTEHKTGEYVKNYYELEPYALDTSDSSIREQIGTKITKEVQAMLPVWFMSYRNKDWVAYAAVNGQTGKVVADLPVDLKKYMLCAVLLALPFFFFYSILGGALNVAPAVLLEMVLLFAGVVSVIYAQKIKQIAIREKKKDDKGAIVASQRKEKKNKKSKKRRKKKLKRKMNRTQIIIICFTIVYCMAYVLPLLSVEAFPLLEDLPYDKMLGIATLVSGAVTVINSLVSLIRSRKLKLWKFLPVPFAYIVATVLAIAALAVYPGVYTYCYIGILALCGVSIWVLIDLIHQYNVFATRKIPQLERRGGDRHA